MEYLLVGGKNDGKRMALPEVPPSVLTMPFHETGSDHIGTEYYHLETFRATEDFLIYRHGTLTTDDVIRMLIASYKTQ